jgi:hypothetical protein
VARKYRTRTGSWHAYGETLRTSAIGAARFLHKATRRHVVRIAPTGKGATSVIMDRDATIVIMGQGPTTEMTGQGLTTVQGLMIMMRNKGLAVRHERDQAGMMLEAMV